MSKKPSKTASNPNDKSDLVLTPGGWRPKSKVHLIEPGHHVSGKGGRLRVIHTATGKVVKDLGAISKKKPVNGIRRPASIPLRGISAKVRGLKLPAPSTGWIVNSAWTNNSGNPISYFSTRWIVPPAPATDNGQTIFLFNGIDTAPTGGFILQPVLQWGGSNAGGGSYWSITNWYVGNGSAMYKSLIKVNPGDVLQGIMKLTVRSGMNFSYLSSFDSFSAADLQVTDVDELVWANETLECYGLTQFTDYPDAILTAFHDIEIKLRTQETPSIIDSEATINWAAQDRVTDNGQQCIIVSSDSPGGDVYLYYKKVVQDIYFITDKSTFGKDEVTDAIANSDGKFANAFWLVLEGFTIDQMTIDQPSPLAPVLSGQFKNLNGISILPSNSVPEYERPDDLYTPQRIRFPFDIQFSSAALNSFPASGTSQEVLAAAITIGGNTFNAQTLFELVAGADPYFTNVDPAQNNVYWLSEDLRVFTAIPGQNSIPVAGGPPFSADNIAGAYDYIQQLLAHLNANYSDPGGTDPFNTVLPSQAGALTGDSSVTPFTFDFSNVFDPRIFSNYNFAIARVRLRGTAGASGAASNVKVFFRLWSTETADTDYQIGSTYPSTLDANGLPASPQVGADHHTLPFFATGNLSGNTDYNAGGINNRTIQINTGDSVWAYFGCFLNLYDSGNVVDGQQIQHWLNGTHHCIVAQIAYDDAPIVNSNGVTMNPENSDKLAQRNLQITLSDNPGLPATHRIPQTFDTRPSPPLTGQAGNLLDYPDELMIDWGDVPVGSAANIYWPQVNASQVAQIASQLYSNHSLLAVDANTIQCRVVKGVTYIPIPPGAGQNFAGLFTVDLPPAVVKGQEFNIIVRRVTTRRPREEVIAGPAAVAVPAVAKGVPGRPPSEAILVKAGFRNWRYVVGTFQVKIPVTDGKAMLFPEENTLAIMKWRFQQMAPSNRWYPVLKRYISYISARVDGLGGNAAAIEPSLQGVPPRRKNRREADMGYTGKVCGLIYDRFGDFEGFILDTEDGERKFHARETEIELVVRRAWAERIVTTVFVEQHAPHRLEGIVLHCPPRPFQH
ncbi:MAG TPA: hypothetical protein VL171_15575 [Verrucomicrobiae bacterium]|nr:hypothetical protein [Verrucomicrobiae bacterium]